MADIIFKIQRQMNGRLDPEQCLVYDEHRTFEFFYQLTGEQADELFKDCFKVYVLGRIEDKKFQVLKTVEPQEW